MGRAEEARAKFLLVRDAIDVTIYPNAYRMAYQTPFRFYEEHTTEEAIAILIKEYERDGD
jgi:hypothetical protein